MRVLVTGATGFLGRHVGPALLLAGHDVLGTTRTPDGIGGPESRLALLRMDGDLPDQIRDYAPEVVVHLVWDGIPDFGADRCQENQRSQEAFFQQMLEVSSVRRVVVAGTCREYGDEVDRAPGSMGSVPVDDCGESKDGLHRSLRAWCDSQAVTLVWLRIFYAYGPGQRPGSLIPSIIEQVESGTWPRVENPEGRHDFVHVDDVATAFVASVGCPEPPPVVDVGWGRTHRVADVVDTVTAVVDGGEVVAGARTRSRGGLQADRLTGEALGWHPTVGLAQGVRTMLQGTGFVSS